MKFLFHLHGLAIGGYETQIWELTRQLDQAGHQSLVVCPEGPVFDYFKSSPCKLHPLLGQDTNWERLLITEKPNIGITVQGSIGYVAKAFKQLNIPLLWICGFPPQKLSTFETMRSLSPLLFDQVLVPSNYMKAEVETYLETPARVLTVGVDTERFCPKNKCQREEIRQRMCISDEEVLIGFAGRYAPHKKQLDLIKLLKLLREHHYPAKLLLMGWSQPQDYQFYFDTLISQISHWGLSPYVHFVSANSTYVPHFLASLDVFVSPARDEGLGCSLLEAMATEIPVVVAKGSGAAEPIELDHCGLGYPVGETDSLFHNVRCLIDSNEAAIEMAKRARQVVQERYSHHALLESFLSIPQVIDAAHRMAAC